MKKYGFLLFLFLFIHVFTSYSQIRREFLLEQGWKFTRSNQPEFSSVDCNDDNWQSVTVPHDWAIYGPFSATNDQQTVAIAEDGQQEVMNHAGRTGGLPFVGTGWYRVKFDVPGFDQHTNVSLVFDGAMSNPVVYLNGEKVGHWAYGYNSFHFDITSLVRQQGNVLAVQLTNLPESSRWYPGAGLYRNVHVVVTHKVHIPVWGTYVTTPKVTKEFAKVNLVANVVRPALSDAGDYSMKISISDKEGNVLVSTKRELADYDGNQFQQELFLENPQLWHPDNPYLYKALFSLYEKEELKDEYVTHFGVRSIEFIPNEGFYLNGCKTHFKGVCLHHDSGPLGAAVNKAALRRQLLILKDMGCNAIRTSHNMPAPELVSLCDEMGFMLMVETFDEWRMAKCKNGYHLYFDEWAEKDLVNVIHQFRNNPSVVLWCIGNEVPEQGAKGGSKVARFLQDICHREDPTRPVTVGMDKPKSVITNNFAAVLDVPGFNYRTFMYQENYSRLPQELILGCETASTVSSRGVYKFPVERKAMQKYEDHQSSSYDLEYCDWSNLPEDDFVQHEDLPYCMGEFVWTGFDYLGEPTPYYTDWPSHSSLFGIVDLAGIPKDRYYLYRSHWNKEEETLHILPHWNWKGREGEVTPVFVYTNYPAAELFINGKSQGVQKKDLSVTWENSNDEDSLQELKRQKRYRLMWMDTLYEPGTLRVVAYDEQGQAVAGKEIHTAGEPYALELTADRSLLTADGKDLAFITVRITDKYGNLCTDADRQVRFHVKGAGWYRAGANGNPVSLELFHEPQMTLFNGMLTGIIQTTGDAGEIIVEATARGVKKGRISLHSR